MMKCVCVAAAMAGLCSAVSAQGLSVSKPKAEAPRPRVLQLGPGSAPAAKRPGVVAEGAVRDLGNVGEWTRIAIDREGLARAGESGPFVIPGLRLGTQTVDLEVERFRVTQPTTQFVAGGGEGKDVALAFDPETVVLLRGRVAGYGSSHLYVAVSPSMVNGIINLGPGRATYGVSSRNNGEQMSPGEAMVFLSRGAGGPSSFCELRTCDHHGHGGGRGPGGGDAEPVRGMRQIQIAVETDHEFFQILASETAAAEYVLHLFGAVSDIYIREINTRVDITFARVWPLPNEPFSAGLDPMRTYWQANMGAVPRDVVQMFSGRGDLPGGVAYLNQLCTDFAYGFCGNLVGFFADPQSSSVFTYDPLVAAHELGHNAGTQHTHFYALDTCDTVTTPPQRGTIMSYCNQTISGAMAVEDLTFHKVTRQAMLEYIAEVPTCVVFDCNQNGISDAVDIAAMTSVDVNGNGVPDECDDCNQNNVLDSIDIGTTSFDLNGNQIPDECEPDCNNNDVPDDRDILLGTSIDLHGDGIPDECDGDANSNNQSDYNEIMANMALDIDRNRLLDSREDCDNDGTPDLVELNGAHNGWSASSTQQQIRGYHSVTGVLMNTTPTGSTTPVRDLIITPDRRILVAAANGVREYNASGAFVRTLVATGANLTVPSALLIRPSETLLVADRTGNRVQEFNLSTGAFIGTVVTAGSGTLQAPMGMTFGPNGNLFVTSETNHRVNQYNGLTGAFINAFVTQASGALSQPKGLVFNPVTGNLLVASFGNDRILEYNGATGAFIKIWSIVGVHFDGPWCLRIGRDGQVYVSINIEDVLRTHLTKAKIQVFDARLGNFIRPYVQANDSLILNPTGFDFMPGDATDCNLNQVPDSCDIASGFSLDFNLNGKPDECERTCYANCDLSTGNPVLTANDFQCFLNAFAAGASYANCDGSTGVPVLTANDFQCFLNAFAGGCP